MENLPQEQRKQRLIQQNRLKREKSLLTFPEWEMFFLWRAAGSPAPKSASMPFTDVPKGSYYEMAVLWAVENGITKGTSDTTFSPDATCSRAQIVTFLWRSQKSPAVGSLNPFTDVSANAYYTDAVLWAVEENITKGTTATTFSPDTDCTRAQIVTLLYRAYVK